MLSLLLAYWWIALPAFAVVAVFALRLWAQRRFDSATEDILREAQAGFADGNVTIHSINATGVTEIDGETATLYDIDATISPSSQNHAWAAADLFLYGIDEDGDEDRMRIGEVRQVEQWNGSSFDAIKKTTQHSNEQRLFLYVRFAGAPGAVRFNYNFACFGPVFELPQAEAEVASV